MVGQQLHNLLIHYSQVLPYDSIVLIDHQGRKDDAITAKLLTKYSQYGVHVALEVGAMETGTARDETHVGLLSFRATSRHLNFFFHSMWTNSLRTVIHQEDQGESSSQNETLEWNQNSLFFRPLDKLGKDGKSFKMEMATPIPAPD
jgi:hypothetical protein